MVLLLGETMGDRNKTPGLYLFSGLSILREGYIADKLSKATTFAIFQKILTVCSHARMEQEVLPSRAALMWSAN
jgi:hypothetical protein